MHVRLDGYMCAVHAVADMPRNVCLTYLCVCYAGEVDCTELMRQLYPSWSLDTINETMNQARLTPTPLDMISQFS